MRKTSRCPLAIPFVVVRRSIAIIALAVAWVCDPNVAIGETVRIESSETKSVELSDRVASALKHLAKSPETSHELILSGDFTPSETVKIQWWGEHRLTVSGPANLDGRAMPDSSETMFVAGRNITVSKLRFSGSRGHALVVGGNSDRYEIRRCVFEDCQRSAIHVWNDPHTIRPETARRGTITGNRISRFNLAKAKWANDGITVFDQGVTISKNLISDSPTETNGIRAMGRDLIVERNKVVRVSRDDSGGIYLWGGPHASLFRGNLVRSNHVVGASRGIYLDDGTSGARVEENVVEDSTVCAIFISGGRDNVIERNVVYRAPVFVHIDSRCLGWDSRPEYAEIAKQSFTRLRDALAGPRSNVLTERYPELRRIAESEHKIEACGRPESNRVQHNFAKEIRRVWELMNFSTAVNVNFPALNDLNEPASFENLQALHQGSLGEHFGFRSWDRLHEAGSNDTEQRDQTID